MYSRAEVFKSKSQQSTLSKTPPVKTVFLLAPLKMIAVQ